MVIVMNVMTTMGMMLRYIPFLGGYDLPSTTRRASRTHTSLPMTSRGIFASHMIKHTWRRNPDP